MGEFWKYTCVGLVLWTGVVLVIFGLWSAFQSHVKYKEEQQRK